MVEYLWDFWSQLEMAEARPQILQIDKFIRHLPHMLLYYLLDHGGYMREFKLGRLRIWVFRSFLLFIILNLERNELVKLFFCRRFLLLDRSFHVRSDVQHRCSIWRLLRLLSLGLHLLNRLSRRLSEVTGGRTTERTWFNILFQWV